jgi:tetrahydromethanopterin S-methyltransferase subunit G
MNQTLDGNKWSDLEKFDADGISRIINEKKVLFRSFEEQIRELQSERKEQIHIVKSLRSAIVGFETSGSGRKKLLGEFHVSRKEAQRHRKKRDGINKCVPPPSKILEEWLDETYSSLTNVDNDLTSVPMLNPELSAFSRFFEIQSSIRKKREAEKAHSGYISKVSEMRKISSKLDQNKEEVDKVVLELKDTAEIDGDRVSRKEISRISNRISSIDKKIDSLNADVKKERKELKRVEKYARISSGRGGVSSIEDIRGIAAKGGSLSTEELGALLEYGGFSSISETNKDVEEKPTVGVNPRKKVRRIGVSRKGSRQGRVASRRE